MIQQTLIAMCTIVLGRIEEVRADQNGEAGNAIEYVVIAAGVLVLAIGVVAAVVALVGRYTAQLAQVLEPDALTALTVEPQDRPITMFDSMYCVRIRAADSATRSSRSPPPCSWPTSAST